MINISISEKDTKNFMLKLFKENIFNNFYIISMEIINFAKFSINSISQSTDKNINNNFTKWETIKPYAINIIKGNDKPKYIKIIFLLREEDVFKTSKNNTSFYLNMTFSKNITFTTAIAHKNFTLDKSLDIFWDDYIINFFKQNNIYIDIEN